MSISQTAKDKAASNRFMLIRLTPARLISNDLVSAGAGIYNLSIPGIYVSSVQRNGNTLTPVATVSSNDEWSINDDTGAFQIKLASSPNETSNLVVVFYDLYYTTETTRLLNHDPADPSTKLREWLPLLQTAPTISQTVKDTIVGVMQLDASDIVLIDTDRQFRSYLGRRDSFKDKDVTVWLCVDSVANIQKVFVGTVFHIALDNPIVTITVLDHFAKMKQTAYMGDLQAECVMTRESDSYPNMDPSKVGQPCRYIAARSSPFTTVDATNIFPSPIGTTNQLVTSGLEAVCTDYSPTIFNTTNRTWTLCRQPALTTLDAFGAVSAVNNGDGAAYFNLTSRNGGQIGDTVLLDSTYVPIFAVQQPFTVSSVTYNLATDNAVGDSTTSSVLTGFYSVAIIIEYNGTLYYPLNGRDYTLTQTSTSGGNTLTAITFLNAFEDRLSGIGYLHPSTHRVFFRIDNDANSSHASVMTRLCEAAGLTVNASAFTAADSALSADTAFCIPYIDQTTYDPYLTYVEDLLKSTFGVLVQNASGTVDYTILTVPSGSAVTDSNLYLRSTLTTNVVYADINATLQAYNPHVSNQDAIRMNGQGPNYTVTNHVAKYLHADYGTNVFRHVLAAIENRALRISATLASRKVTYTFETATDNLTTLIGDDLILSTVDVLGITKTQSVKVIGIVKSVNKCTVTACDFEGLQ